MKKTAQISQLEKEPANKGFTLIELSIYMGLLMIFLFLLSGLFVSTLQVQKDSINTARVEQNSHYLVTRLQYDVGQADDLIIPANNGDTRNNLTLAKGASTYNYFLDEGKLKVSDGSSSVILTDVGVVVSELSFQRLGNEDGRPSIKSHMVIQAIDNASQDPYQKEVDFVLGLR